LCADPTHVKLTWGRMQEAVLFWCDFIYTVDIYNMQHNGAGEEWGEGVGYKLT